MAFRHDFSSATARVTLLYGKTIPTHGGDTLWASAAMAFQSLSEPMQRLLEGLEAEHDFAHGFRESLEEPGVSNGWAKRSGRTQRSPTP
ncbi:MAG: hypothetical protein CM1200mP9_01640 [Gammaproteobacteria bacterium]|nr:MAG: hypothetical protein CM1200mP9_01640 [Gammaproteobacteria bacterium]